MSHIVTKPGTDLDRAVLYLRYGASTAGHVTLNGDQCKAILDALEPKPLVSKDGQFSCVPEHAVEVAYMMSCAEALVDEERTDTETTLVAYLLGEISTDEAIEGMTS